MGRPRGLLRSRLVNVRITPFDYLFMKRFGLSPTKLLRGSIDDFKKKLIR